MCQDKKICKKCNRERTLIEFPAKKHMCLECADKSKEERKIRDSEYHKAYYIENKESIAQKHNKYRAENKEKVLERNQIYRDNHKEHANQYAKEKNASKSREERDRINARKRERLKERKDAGELPVYSEEAKEAGRIYRLRNKEKLTESKKRYVAANRKLVTKRKRDWKKRKLQTDPRFRIQNNLRATFRSALKHGYKYSSIFDILGCSLDEFKLYIESLWSEGMTWENWGMGDDKWHIDHIIPVSVFDMMDFEEQKRCWNYTNLRPLWQKDNLEKSDKLPDGSRARHIQVNKNVD